MEYEPLGTACSKSCVYVCTIYAGGFLRTSDPGIPPDSQSNHSTLEKGQNTGPGEMTPPLKALAAHHENQGLDTSTHVRKLTSVCHSSSKIECLLLGSIGTGKCTRAHTHTHKKNKSLKTIREPGRGGTRL